MNKWSLLSHSCVQEAAIISQKKSQSIFKEVVHIQQDQLCTSIFKSEDILVYS